MSDPIAALAEPQTWFRILGMFSVLVCCLVVVLIFVIRDKVRQINEIKKTSATKEYQQSLQIQDLNSWYAMFKEIMFASSLFVSGRVRVGLFSFLPNDGTDSENRQRMLRLSDLLDRSQRAICKADRYLLNQALKGMKKGDLSMQISFLQTWLDCGFLDCSFAYEDLDNRFQNLGVMPSLFDAMEWPELQTVLESPETHLSPSVMRIIQWCATERARES